MFQWNPKYRHNGVPIWLSKLCRAYLKRVGEYSNSGWPLSSPLCVQRAFLHASPEESIFDHVGDIPGYEKGVRHFYVQPYVDFDSGLTAANRIAETLEIRLLESKRVAPWDESACLFLFGPRADKDRGAISLMVARGVNPSL